MKKQHHGNALRSRAYIRVSHVGKRQDTLLSDRMQLEEARRYAEYLGFDFDDKASVEFSDLDVSGFKKGWRQRPGLMAHYEAAKKGEFDILIFFKISRLARNVREALDMIDAFEKIGISFHFVAEKIDSSSAQGRFLRNVLLSAAEMQSEDSSAFLKSTFLRRALDGKVHGAPPLWIKRLGPQEFELIPDQVQAIRRLVELRCQGIGYVKLAQILNEEGHRTVKGKYWTGGMTYKYLQPTYIETMLGTSFFGRGENEPVRIPNAFPSILSSEEADLLLALQKLYSDDLGRKPVDGRDWMKNRRPKSGRYSASSIHLLSSILFCPQCGSRMVPHSKPSNGPEKTQVHRYLCPRGVSSRDLHPNGLTVITASMLEDAVLRVIRGVLVLPPKNDYKSSQIPPVRLSGLNEVQEKIDRLVSLHLDGKIDDQDYERIYADLLAKRTDFQAVKEEMPLLELYEQATKLMVKEQLTREELRQLVLLSVERVEAPLTIEGVAVRRDLKTLRRLAKVVLRVPSAEGATVFYSGIYESRYRGERKFVSDTQDPRTLVGERFRDR